MRRLPASLWCLLAVLVAPTAGFGGERFKYPEGKSGGGELRYVNGIPVLLVSGTPQEIGTQVAELGVKPASRLLHYPNDFIRAATTGPLLNMLGEKLNGVTQAQAEDMKSLIRSGGMLALNVMGRRLYRQFLPDHRAEVEAIIKATGEDPDTIILANTMFDIKKIAGCSTLIIEPARSGTGGTLFGRNLDFPTLGYLQDYSIVQVYRPAGKRPFATVGFPGLVGCLSGINDSGLSVAILEVYQSKDGAPKYNSQGQPNFLTFRRVLEECSTVDEAVRLLRDTPRTSMANLAVCDRNGGVVIEMTTKNVVVRKAEDGICSCTNHFRSPELATDKRCKRFEQLEQTRNLAKVGIPDVAAALDAANQHDFTLQTMIFEPATLALHLAIGPTPSSALPMKDVDLAALFKGDWPAK